MTKRKPASVGYDYMQAQITALTKRSESVEARSMLLATNPAAPEDRLKVEKVEQNALQLKSDVSDLTRKLDKTNQVMQETIKDVKTKWETLQFSIVNLDHQFNNLTTENLAEHIIGHLDRLYPQSRQIVENITVLDRRAQAVERRLDELDKMEERQEQVRDSDKRSEKSDAAQSAKKRKIDSTLDKSNPNSLLNTRLLPEDNR